MNPEYSQSNKNKANTFNPLDIETNTEVTYNEQTIEIELDPETNTVYQTKTVIVESDPETQVITV